MKTLGAVNIVLLHTTHVIADVPLTWKAVPGNGPLTAPIGTEIGHFSVAVHRVRLALVSKKLGGGREATGLATIQFAAVQLDVRI